MDLLFFIQLLHTLITLGIYTCIFYTIYGGIRRLHNSKLLWAHLIVLGEGLILALNNYRCPLRSLVDRLYDVHTPDILLPDAIGEWLIEAGTMLFVVGLGLNLRNIVEKRRAPQGNP